MKKNFLTAILVLFSLTFCFSQDIITKKTSEDIQAKVTEITTTEIKYKKFDNLNGPVFTILKSDVLMIRYQNGSKDIFTESQKANTSTNMDNNASIDMRIKGREDAITNYKGKNSGAGWTGATTILFSPLVGLIPAVACSSSEPSDNNLNYQSSQLMKSHEYNQAYRQQAHKIKKKKIWTRYGISSGLWLVLILAIGA
ncbi:hypothetical protein P1X15_08665 [Runella sp. MFBS21]|uniref:hypothetical protein n=1 Tax=Runella sp. MFBS21 TaxID=3034018 RepID=UPI0023F91BEC|nr:hypothetical protein [Runella sp. MFBS21]MDF7817666.1 hypothetical protein [Runella sp. MFBS21]